MKHNVYEVEKNIEKILRGYSTGFLPINVVNEIKGKLRKNEYQVFVPYDGAEKIILYGNIVPKVKLYRINCYLGDKITHSSIMGSLFGLNITSEMFGDIVWYENNFYVYILDSIHEFIENQFVMVGNVIIDLEEVPVDFLNDYQREYEVFDLSVNSLRIDAVISRLIGCNRDSVQEKIKDKLVFVNGDILNKVSYILKDNDVFSIRGYGKYMYSGVKGTTKKGKVVVEINKYV